MLSANVYLVYESSLVLLCIDKTCKYKSVRMRHTRTMPFSTGWH